jgi:hypothetical protein
MNHVLAPGTDPGSSRPMLYEIKVKTGPRALRQCYPRHHVLTTSPGRHSAAESKTLQLLEKSPKLQTSEFQCHPDALVVGQCE